MLQVAFTFVCGFGVALGTPVLLQSKESKDAALDNRRKHSFLHQKIPGLGEPRWGGTSFDHSPVSGNDWVHLKPDIAVVDNLDPAAPLDRLSGISDHESVSGALPLAPGSSSSAISPPRPPMEPDYVPSDETRTFPVQQPFDVDGNAKNVGGLASPPGSPQLVPLNRRHLIAKGDRFRPSSGPPLVGTIHQQLTYDPSDDYPLTAPRDRIPDGLEAVPAIDRVPDKVARFLDQNVEHEERLASEKRLADVWDAADANKDGAVSTGEFQAEVQGKQNKTSEETSRLWKKYHQSESKFMSKSEFLRLARTGFDLGSLTRTDVSSILSPQGMPSLGFWSSGAACPSGTFATAVRLKIMKFSAVDDNSGINGLKLRCSDQSEVSTIEGPDGSWGPWSSCDGSQSIYGFRSEGKAPVPGADNAGVTGLDFECRSADLSQLSRLSLPSLTGEESSAQHKGGWSRKLRCRPREAVCGVQVNLPNQDTTTDKMGVTNVRFHCCDAPIDCTKVCRGATDGVKAMKCRACRNSLGLPRV